MRKQEEILEIFNRKCVECTETQGLAVHHTNYRNLWREKPYEDVVPLCGEHHKEAHGIECDEFEIELVA